MKLQMRYPVLALALVAFGCSAAARPFNDPVAIARLKEQAADVERAMIQKDHERMADLTHPVLVNHFGGRAGYIKHLDETADDLHRQGLKFHRFRFATLSELFEVSGGLYAIYSYSLELTSPDGEPAAQPSYLVCTSNDKGARWHFLDGAGVGNDRSKLLRWLPEFPEELTLPRPQRLRVGQ